MKIEKIDHVAIRVKDLAKARKFFSEVFEMDFRSLGNSAELDIKSIMDTNGIELVEPFLPDGPNSRMIAKYGRGINAAFLEGLRPGPGCGRHQEKRRACYGPGTIRRYANGNTSPQGHLRGADRAYRV